MNHLQLSLSWDVSGTILVIKRSAQLFPAEDKGSFDG
jgi:hypothetical protein